MFDKIVRLNCVYHVTEFCLPLRQLVLKRKPRPPIVLIFTPTPKKPTLIHFTHPRSQPRLTITRLIFNMPSPVMAIFKGDRISLLDTLPNESKTTTRPTIKPIYPLITFSPSPLHPSLSYTDTSTLHPKPPCMTSKTPPGSTRTSSFDTHPRPSRSGSYIADTS